MTDPKRTRTSPLDLVELRRRAVGNMTDRTGRMIEQAADEIERLREALEQAQACILGDTPEGCSKEEARADTLAKIREALS